MTGVIRRDQCHFCTRLDMVVDSGGISCCYECAGKIKERLRDAAVATEVHRCGECQGAMFYCQCADRYFAKEVIK